MVEIEVAKKTVETVTVDVDFPVYRAHAGSVTKITEDGTAITVRADEGPRSSGDKYRVEVREDYDFTESSGMDYHLGRGGYHGSEMMFNRRLEKISDVVREVVEQHD